VTLFDAAVVGGGPAGCSAAIRLAERGARVVLFEAKIYPHPKVCGEFLSPECLFLLDRLGLLSALRALKPVPIQRVELTAPDGTTWESSLPGMAWGISREALDAAMAARAREVGVTVLEGTTVTDIDGDLRRGFALNARTEASTTGFTARTVIAAHGKRSLLDRALDRRFLNKPQPFVALKAHFRGPSLPNRIELHIFPGGYCGLSEIEGGAANVCLLVREAVFQAHGSPQAFIDWMRRQNPRLEAWLGEAERISPRWLSIAQVPFSRKSVLEGDIIMTGDAAGLIAPLAGDGISMALYGGRLAAQHVTAFLGGQVSPDMLRRRYAAAWQRDFGSRLRLGRALQAIMLRPGLFTPVLRLIASFPPLGRTLINRTRDTRFIGKQGDIG